MRMTITSVLVAVLGTACVGGAPDAVDDDDVVPDDTTDEVTDVADDGMPVDTDRAVSGMVMDYFGEDPLPDSVLTAEGVQPAATATAGIDAMFTFDAIPVGSKIILGVTRPNYRATRNVATTVGETDVTANAYAIASVFVTRQHATLGTTPTAGKAFVVADLRRADGTPLVDVLLTGVTLVGPDTDIPVPGVLGPYVLGATGDIVVDPLVTTTTLANGKAQVAFLDVPAGEHAVKLTYDAGQGPLDVRGLLTTTADGATITLVGGADGGGATGEILDPTFAAHIYPRLQRAATGGLGCANCHTAAGAGAVLPYDGLAPDVLAAILARPGVVDLLAPADSLLLTKPLYEPLPPQNHPNATFLTIEDPDYKLILRWITNGAKP